MCLCRATAPHCLGLSILLAGWPLSGIGQAAESPRLVDISRESGLDFVHFNGMTGALYFPEMTGQGGAFLDYDGDGDLDIYLVQGAWLDGGPDQAPGEVTTSRPPRDRLYRNELHVGPDGSPRLRFVDVTDASGLRALGYGMGVAVGDVDNDGWPDLYLTNYGPNELWRNRGDGRFEDVTAAFGVGDRSWSASASFLDFDNDGWLDLYVANYVDFSVAENPACYAPSSRRDYCGPAAFRGTSDRLYRNRGDGSFEDLSAQVGLHRLGGSGLGVVSLDVDDDGWIDWAVANDGEPNFLWHNLGGGAISEEGLLSGTALNSDGKAEASMGVDAGDFDRDGDEDLFFAHLDGETNTLYVNQGDGLFEDRTRILGLATPSLPYTSFGAVWIDVDLDGWLDLAVASGAVRILEELAGQGHDYPLELANQLYRNLEGRRFEDMTANWAPGFLHPEVSRGLVAGDIDRDGDMDLLLLNNRGAVRLYQSRSAQQAAWLGVLAQDGPGRSSLGTRIEVADRSHRSVAWVRTDGSYASARDPAVLFSGLSAAELIVHIRHPDRRAERWIRPKPDSVLVIPAQRKSRGRSHGS